MYQVGRECRMAGKGNEISLTGLLLCVLHNLLQGFLSHFVNSFLCEKYYSVMLGRTQKDKMRKDMLETKL